MEEHLLVNLIAYTIAGDYLEDKDDINKLIEKYNKYCVNNNFKPKNYENKLANLIGNLTILNEILKGKKFKTHKEDALKITVLMEAEIIRLEKLFKGDE